MSNGIQMNAAADGGTMIRMNFGSAVSLRASAGGDPDVRKYKLKGYTGGKVSLPGYPYKVVFDLRTLRKNDGDLPLLLDHDFSQAVGHTTKLDISEKSITGFGVTSIPGAPRDRVNGAAVNKFVWQMSVGGYTEKTDIEFIPEGRTVSVNGRALQGPFFLARNYHLREISFVSMGADDEGASAVLVAALDSRKGIAMNFVAWLSSKGKDINSLTAAELSTLRREFETLQAGGAGGGTPAGGNAGTEGGANAGSGAAGGNAGAGTVAGGSGSGTSAGGAAGGAAGGGAAQGGTASGSTAPAGGVVGGASQGTGTPTNVVVGNVNDDFVERRAREIERLSALETLNAQFGNPTMTIEGGRQVPLLAHAARNGWTTGDFELHCLRAQRPQAPQTRTQDPDNVAILQAAFVGAFVQRAGIALDHPFFGSPNSREYMNAAFTANVNDPGRQRWMNAAAGFRHHSMVDMVREVCRVEGVVDLDRAGHWRSPQWMRAAFSSLAVQDLFTQSIQAVLMATYEEQRFAGLSFFVQHRDVPNFLSNERPRVLLGGNDFELLLPTATAKEITMSSTGEAYKIGTFAAMIRINDETLTNERFDVIDDQPKAMGIAAGRIEPELLFELLLTNPNMKDGNPAFITGFNRRTGSAFSDTNLEAALNQFGLMKENGQTINLEASDILHSRSKRFAVARVLAQAPLITGANATTTSQNVMANIVNPTFDARLDNGFTSPKDRKTTIAGEPNSWFIGDRRYPAIEMGHLQGTSRGLVLDNGRMTEGQWGLWFAGRKSCGAAFMRRESIQKNEQ